MFTLLQFSSASTHKGQLHSRSSSSTSASSSSVASATIDAVTPILRKKGQQEEPGFINFQEHLQQQEQERVVFALPALRSQEISSSSAAQKKLRRAKGPAAIMPVNKQSSGEAAAATTTRRTDRVEAQATARSRASSQGSWKELPPLPLEAYAQKDVTEQSLQRAPHPTHIAASRRSRTKRASSASTASSASYLPRLDLGNLSLELPEDLLSSPDDEDVTAVQTRAVGSAAAMHDRTSTTSSKRSSRDSTTSSSRLRSSVASSHMTLEGIPEFLAHEPELHALRPTSKRASRQEETRRTTALWVDMLGDLSEVIASSPINNELSRSAPAAPATETPLLSAPAKLSPPISPSASSDCCDPYFRPSGGLALSASVTFPLPPACPPASPAFTLQEGRRRAQTHSNFPKPLPASPLEGDVRPAFANPFDASFAAAATAVEAGTVGTGHLERAMAPRRASLPVASSTITRAKRAACPTAPLPPIAEPEALAAADSPAGHQAFRSLNLPQPSSRAPSPNGHLPSLASTSTIRGGEAGPAAQHLSESVYRFPSPVDSPALDVRTEYAIPAFEPTSYDMARSREASFSSTASSSSYRNSYLYESDAGGRSRRSSNFTSDSSIPSPRFFGASQGHRDSLVEVDEEAACAEDGQKGWAGSSTSEQQQRERSASLLSALAPLTVEDADEQMRTPRLDGDSSGNGETLMDGHNADWTPLAVSRHKAGRQRSASSAVVLDSRAPVAKGHRLRSSAGGGRNFKHLRLASEGETGEAAAAQGKEAGTMVRSPTMEIIMYGMAM